MRVPVSTGLPGGRDIRAGKTAPPAGVTVLEYALYHLLHAVEDLAQMHGPSRR